MKINKISHPYHLVENSPWPFFTSLITLDVLLSLVLTIYNKLGKDIILGWSIISLLICVYLWVNEIIREGTYKGDHTKKVAKNLFVGFILFVVSEIAIFVSLFIAYFYNSLIPSIEIGSEWPPIGISILNPSSIPLYNTLLLYFSGISITISQNNLYNRKKLNTIYYLLVTIILGLDFSYVQYLEYYYAWYTISDSIYASNFYILTGFHGIHVIIGTILLIITLIRLLNNHFTNKHHIGYTSSGIYWHFVDYVWLILYTFLYCWAS